MAEQNEPLNEILDAEELQWLLDFARILLADVPDGFDTFETLVVEAYAKTISREYYLHQMGELLKNYPQLRLAVNKVNMHGRTYKLDVSKDLLDEWSDWKQRWTADTEAHNPTVYESHLFRCFLTIKAEINSIATEDYAMVLEERLDINEQEAEELAALGIPPTAPHPPSPIFPPIDDNAIRQYFKSIKEILNADDERDEAIYTKFKDILVAHGENLDYPIGETGRVMKLSKVGVCQELCELLQNHTEILSNFIQFLPHIGHIARNVAEYNVTD